jgi:predicted ATPase
MINKIGFQNIRVFADLTEFELKPLTVLTGSNNSGKSAMQKMLLLLSEGFKPKNGEIQLDKLFFKKEYINKTGDFKSNVNYNHQTNQIHFTFQFKDELFGLLNAELIFEGDDSAITANLIEITISDFESKLFALKKGRPNPNEDISIDQWIWKWDLELLSDYFKKLRKLLLKFRKEGERDMILKNISIKLNISKQLEPLTPLENQVYGDYKKQGIIAFDSRAIEIQEKRKNIMYDDGRPNHKIFNENTNDIWKPHALNKVILKKFPSAIDGSDFLIYTDLLKVTAPDFNKFLLDTDQEYAALRKEFKRKGIMDSEKFMEEYKKFEMICLHKSFGFSYSETQNWNGGDEAPYSYSINEILSKKNYGEVKFANLNAVNETNEILSILQKFYPHESTPQIITDETLEMITMEPSISKSASSPNLKENTTEEKEDFFNICLGAITKYYTNPFKNFIDDLDEMLKRTIIFSTNTKIKRQYLYGDFDVLDSPFLEFGVEHFKDDYSAKIKIKFINKWLNELEIADELKASKIKLENKTQGQYLGFYYSLMINNQEVPLFDCGSGIHQIVLLLLNIVNADYSKTFLLEEPETNMHPMLQSKLADLFVEAKNKFRINFIIETHSEYLIRKLQYLTAKNDISTEDIVIYYFNADTFVTSDEPKVKKIEIRKNGQLTESFGKGFLDETTMLQFELYKLNNSQSN